MSFRERIREFVLGQIKENPVAQQLIMLTSGTPQYPETDAENLASEGVEKCVTAYSCITMIAASSAAVPWQLFEKKTDGKLVEVEDPNHELIQLWNKPNPKWDGRTFREWWCGYLLTAGNSYWTQLTGSLKPSEREVRRRGTEAKPPKELWLLAPSRVHIEPSATGPHAPIGKYLHRVSGQDKPFDPDQVAHSRLFHPRHDFFGLSPVAVAALSINTDIESKNHNWTLVKNRGRPDGILSSAAGTTVSPKQQDEIKEQVEERLGGAKRGLPLALSGGWSWSPLSFTPVEMDYLRSAAVTAKSIAQVFHVPPEMIGDSENKTFSNYKEARQAFWTDACIPILEILAGRVNLDLVPRYGDNLVLRPDLDSIEALAPSRDALWERAQGSDFLTVDEKRTMVGYEAYEPPENPDEEPGAVILVPATLRPLGEEEDLTETEFGEEELDDEGNPIEPKPKPEDDPPKKPKKPEDD